MKRMFGMMPRDEVKREESFKDQHGYTITIQAGPNGWAVLWADGGASGKDFTGSVDENYAAGLALVKAKGFTLKPILPSKEASS